MDIEVMLESPYVTFMAVRPLKFGDKEYQPGQKIPQRLLAPMRDPEVLIRTGMMAAVAKDMNKVPTWIRPAVEDEGVMRNRVTASTHPMGPIVPNHLLERIEEVLEEHVENGEPIEIEPEEDGNVIVSVGDIVMEMTPEDAQALYAEEDASGDEAETIESDGETVEEEQEQGDE